MMFHKHNKIVKRLDLHANNNAIEKVDNFNFLGLHLNTRLTWHTHVSEISKKISRAVGIIKKMQWIFPTEILLAIYKALVLPHINGNFLCRPHFSSTFLGVMWSKQEWSLTPC